MELRGILLTKGEVKTFESGFKSQEFYLDCKRYDQFTGVAYENILKFQASKSGILDALTTLNKGAELKLQFRPQGRTYEKKDGTGRGHIQSLDVYKIEVVSSENKPKEASTTSVSSNTNDPVGIDEDPDLPF